MNTLRNTRPLALLVALAVLALPMVHAAPASAQTGAAQLTITGGTNVRIDGVAAATGATIFSGSRISTGGGTNAVVSLNGSRVTLKPETDAVVTYGGSLIRADIICGAASADPGPGFTVEMITHGDTSVYVQAGTAQVMGDGKTFSLVANQTQTVTGGTRIVSAGPASFEISTILCSCLCAAPVPFPIPVVGISGALLGAIIGAAAAAVIVPVTIALDDETPVSPATP